MSLNGLDSDAIKEAYRNSLAEAGSWFLLLYVSRDVVELHTRGSGGLVELRTAIGKCDGDPPLYGFILYRRRKVLVKYLPESASRLVRARVAVHFEFFCDRFSPYDIVFTAASVDDFTDSAFSASCHLHAATPLASCASSISSAQKIRLDGITEDAEEGFSLSPPLHRSPSLQQSVQGSVQESTRDAAASDLSADQVRSSDAQSEHTVRNDTSEAPRPETPASHLNPTDSVDKWVSSVQVNAGDGYLRSDISLQKDNLSVYTTDSRTSSIATRPTPSELADYDFLQAWKPKTRLAPRPSQDRGKRPKTPGSNSIKSVASLPAGLRASSRRSAILESAAASDSISSYGVDPPPVPPIPLTPLRVPSPARSAVSNLSATSERLKPFNMSFGSRSPGLSKEKQRLMKALQLRKQQITMSNSPSTDLPSPDIVEPTTPKPYGQPLSAPQLPSFDLSVAFTPTIEQFTENFSTVTSTGAPTIARANTEKAATLPTELHNERQTIYHRPQFPRNSVNGVVPADPNEAADRKANARSTAIFHSTPQDESVVAAGLELRRAVDADGKLRSAGKSEELVENFVDRTVRAEEIAESETAYLLPVSLILPEIPTITVESDGFDVPAFEEVSSQPTEAESHPPPDTSASNGSRGMENLDHTHVAKAVSASNATVLPPRENFDDDQYGIKPQLAEIKSLQEVERPFDRSTDSILPSANGKVQPFAGSARQTSRERRHLSENSIDLPLQGILVSSNEAVPYGMETSWIRDPPSAIKEAAHATTTNSTLEEADNSRTHDSSRTPNSNEDGSPAQKSSGSLMRNLRGGKLEAVRDSLTPDSSDAGSVVDDRLMEELHKAKVQEAKPISVFKTPVTPYFSRGPSSGSIASMSKRLTSLPRNATPVAGFMTPESAPNASPRSPLVVKKANVSSGISQRIKALTQSSSRQTASSSSSPSSTIPSPVKTPDASPSTIAQRVSSLRSLSNPLHTPPPSDFGPAKSESILKRARRLSRTSISSNIIPQTEGRWGDQADYQPNYQKSVERPKTVASKPASIKSTVSVPAERKYVLRDTERPPTSVAQYPIEPKEVAPNGGNRSDSRAASLRQSSDIASEQPPLPPRKSSPLPTMPGLPARHSSRRHARHKSDTKSMSNSVRSMSNSSFDDEENHDEKKTSRRARLFKRMSGLSGGARKSIISVISPSVKEEEHESILSDKPALSVHGGGYTAKPAPTEIGDLNVQFPDTLLWKRRYIEIDGYGNMILSPSKSNQNVKGAIKRYHLSEFHLPLAPDADRQEMPNSIILDFVHGGTLQCACEDAFSHARVLHLLQMFHEAWASAAIPFS